MEPNPISKSSYDMENKQLDAALYYLNKCNFSVIPAKTDKRPFIQWQQFQKEKPPESVVRKWWGEQYKFANIAIITGKVSGLTVLDVDTQTGKQLLEENLPDSFLTPIVDTPGGGEHLYCQYEEGVTNAVRFMDGCDIRSEGGYVIAPPSSDARGGWKWRNGCKITDVPISTVPAKILTLIASSISSLKSIGTSNNIYTNTAKSVPNLAINLNQGTRDESFFHIVTRLIHGNTPIEEITQILELLNQLANPPFPKKELDAKIASALKRSDSREKTLISEVTDWVVSSSGDFLSSDVAKELGLSSRVVMKNLSKILNRLCEDKVIEKTGKKRGSFRTVDRTIREQCWWQDTGQPMPIKFPLEIEQFAKIFPGNIVLLEGQKSQGKSAFALEFCRLNRRIYPGKILYQNVEMADSELLDRFKSYGDVMPLDEWRESVTFIRQTQDWWDKILPDGLNVVDYLIEYKDAFMIPDFIWKIHQKLSSGIALIVVQRDPNKPYPTGGRGVRDIPRAVISLIKHKVRLEDVKSFYQTDYGNPTGLCRRYKQVNWWNLKADSGWDLEEEEKYNQFKGDKK